MFLLEYQQKPILLPCLSSPACCDSMFCSLTKVNQLWGAGALPRGHCAEPSRGHDLWGLCLSGLLPLPWLSNKWDRWAMSHTSSLASSSVSLPPPPSQPPAPRPLLCPPLPLLLHPRVHFPSPSCLYHPFSSCLSIAACPLSRRPFNLFTPNASPFSHSTDSSWWISSNRLALHAIHPTSDTAALLIPLFLQVASFPYDIFPRTMNTGCRLKWWLSPRTWGERVHLHELIHRHLKDLTDKQRLRGCQHTTLISQWWTEWKNVSYLVPSTRSSSDRCAAAPKSIRDCTFSTPLDPGIRSVLTRKASPYPSDLSVLVRLKLSSLYAGMWELNVLMY